MSKTRDFDGSLLLCMLELDLKRAQDDGKKTERLAEIVDHIRDLEKKTRYLYSPPTGIKHKTDKNIWESNLDEAIDVIKNCIDSPNWSWSSNSNCKYVTLHIDMRNGGFTLMNRGQQRISLDHIKYQYEDSTNPPEAKKVTTMEESFRRFYDTKLFTNIEACRMFYNAGWKDGRREMTDE